jgi:hypothetical protein
MEFRHLSNIANRQGMGTQAYENHCMVALLFLPCIAIMQRGGSFISENGYFFVYFQYDVNEIKSGT